MIKRKVQMMLSMPVDLTILVPSSLTIETRDERIRTYRVGQIARAASVFRVSTIIIYHDAQFDDSKFIDLILRYAETPQYLRKYLFPIRRELKHVGILPPLRTPHHPIKSRSSDIDIGEFRVGVVVPGPQSEKKVGSDTNVWVDIGIDSPVRLITPSKPGLGERVNVRIFSRRPVQVKPVEIDEIPIYWGYRTIKEKSLSGTLENISRQNSLILVATRKGQVLNAATLAHIGDQLKQVGKAAIVFGSPKEGVESILAREGSGLSNFQCESINTIPAQGTATVRTEEAVWATLSLINLVR